MPAPSDGPRCGVSPEGEDAIGGCHDRTRQRKGLGIPHRQYRGRRIEHTEIPSPATHPGEPDPLCARRLIRQKNPAASIAFDCESPHQSGDVRGQRDVLPAAAQGGQYLPERIHHPGKE